MVCQTKDGETYNTMTEINQNVCNELYFLLSALDDTLSPSLYAFKCQIENQVYQQFSIQEIERLKAQAKANIVQSKGKNL